MVGAGPIQTLAGSGGRSSEASPCTWRSGSASSATDDAGQRHCSATRRLFGSFLNADTEGRRRAVRIRARCHGVGLRLVHRALRRTDQLRVLVAANRGTSKAPIEMPWPSEI